MSAKPSMLLMKVDFPTPLGPACVYQTCGSARLQLTVQTLWKPAAALVLTTSRGELALQACDTSLGWGKGAAPYVMLELLCLLPALQRGGSLQLGLLVCTLNTA